MFIWTSNFATSIRLDGNFHTLCINLTKQQHVTLSALHDLETTWPQKTAERSTTRLNCFIPTTTGVLLNELYSGHIEIQQLYQQFFSQTMYLALHLTTFLDFAAIECGKNKLDSLWF